MNWKKTAILVGALVIAVAAGVVLWRGGLPFRANRVTYLMNARRFPEALDEYERLAREHPREAERLAPDFRGMLIGRAASYYSQNYTRRLEAEAYRAFLDDVGRRPELLPLARRRRLEFTALLNGKSSETLAAAREILQHEGYDHEAYWWAAYNQYDPARPFTIPGEVLRYREAFEQSEGGKDGRTAVEQDTRRSFLTALLAVADRNWAEAAAALDEYRRARPKEAELDLIRGLAFLKAGHPEAAIQRLMQFREGWPDNPSALRYLADAYLALGDMAWAGHALHEIRATAPEQEALVLGDALGTDAEDPLAQACGFLGPGGPCEGDVALAAWLGEMAATDTQRQAADAAMEQLAASPDDLNPAEQTVLAQYFLTYYPEEAAARMPGRDAAMGAADTTTTLRRRALERLLAQAPRLLKTDGEPTISTEAGSTGLADQAPLTHAATYHFKMRLPAGAALLCLVVKGMPERGVGPIVHVNLGALGAKTFYVGNGQDRVRPLVLALRRPAGEELEAEGSVSLLNGSTDRAVTGRGLRILRIVGF